MCRKWVKSVELRVLKYFLTVAQMGSVTKAADALFITQPTLSRQLAQLEEDLGVALFIRGKRKMMLTEEGLLLQRRAEEIISLANLTESELLQKNEEVSGSIGIGCGSTKASCWLSEKIKDFVGEYPKVHFSIKSGNTQNVLEYLENGMIDIAVVLDPVDLEKYSYIHMKDKERWGLFTHKDSPLATKQRLTATDLLGVPLMNSPRVELQNKFRSWCPDVYDDLNFAANCELAMNMVFFMKNKVASAIVVEGALDGVDMSDLVFIPFEPHLTSEAYIVWKKYQSFSLTVSKFIDYISKN